MWFLSIDLNRFCNFLFIIYLLHIICCEFWRETADNGTKILDLATAKLIKKFCFSGCYIKICKHSNTELCLTTDWIFPSQIILGSTEGQNIAYFAALGGQLRLPGAKWYKIYNVIGFSGPGRSQHCLKSVRFPKCTYLNSCFSWPSFKDLHTVFYSQTVIQALKHIIYNKLRVQLCWPSGCWNKYFCRSQPLKKGKNLKL
jgi:hypothetical protein